MQNKKKMIFSILLVLVFLALFALICIDLIPLVKQVIENIHDETKTIQYVKAYGTRAVPILIALQMLQVVVPFIPAAPIQVLAGLCYGVFWGTVISVTGYVLGNMLVFFMLRQFRKTFETFFKPQKKQKKHKSFSLETIKNAKKPEYAAFLLYAIPGIPNGILPYIFADSKITYRQYLLSITLASIPSTLLCSWLGNSLANLNFDKVAILAGILAVLLILFFVFKNKIRAKVQKILAE